MSTDWRPLDEAIRLHEEWGIKLRVFRLQPFSTMCLPGPREVSDDLEQIRQWRDAPEFFNWGFVAGQGADVIDLDEKNGNSGILTFRRKLNELGLGPNPDEQMATGVVGEMLDESVIYALGPVVRTPRHGGRHLFVLPSGLPTKIGAWPGVDYCAAGQPVYGPGSVLRVPAETPSGYDLAAYQWVSHGQPQALPGVLRDALAAAIPTAKHRGGESSARGELPNDAYVLEHGMDRDTYWRGTLRSLAMRWTRAYDADFARWQCKWVHQLTVRRTPEPYWPWSDASKHVESGITRVLNQIAEEAALVASYGGAPKW